MVKVLQILPSLNCCGGVENYIMNYYRKIDKTKIQFDFLYHLESPVNFIEEIKKMGGNVFKQPKFSIRNFNIIVDNFCEILKANKYDAIHCHQANAAFLYLKIAEKQNVKLRILHSHQSKASDTIMHSIRNIPLLYIGKKYSNFNIACSNLAGKYLFNKANFTVINNAVEVSMFKYNEELRKEIREKFNICASDYVIGHVGRFCNQKNQLFLLKVFKSISNENPRVKLMLIGDGELKSKITRYIEKNNLIEKVILTGSVNDVYKYYNSMDLLVMPSIYEGLPVVGVEAQYNGLNMIVSDNITNELNFSKNIIYLNLRDVEKWEETIIFFINNGKRNIVVSSEYDINEQVKCLENLYIKLSENEN